MMQIFVLFFLWSNIFSSPDKSLFGYNRDKILTYVFGILMLRAIVLSARAVDVAGEISRGDLSNYLVKPLNYFKYYLTRDLSSKFLNLLFAVFEGIILYIILRPPFFLQTDVALLALFMVSVVLAVMLFFHLLMLVNMITFWAPEAGWSGQFLFVVIFTEFLSGGAFPLDILPNAFQQILYSLPFPYLLFFPLQIYLGKLSLDGALFGIMVAGVWLVVLMAAVRYIWNKGLKEYEAFGK